MTRDHPPSGTRKADPKPTSGTPANSLGRRAALKKGLGAVGGVLAAGVGAEIAGPARADTPGNLPPDVPEWSRTLGPGVANNPYGVPSRHESHVVRRALEGLSPTPQSSGSFTPLQDLHGIVTPNGLVFERHHAGIPDIDPADHRLVVHGLVERPLMFSVADILRFPSVSRFYFIECSGNGFSEWKKATLNDLQFTHGLIQCCQWTGVPLATVLGEAGVKPNGKWLLAESADGVAHSRSIPMEKALDDVLLVYAQNGEKLRPEQGYPLRLVVPGWEGNINVKWLRRLEVGDRPWQTREETSKYTDLLADGRARQFTFVQEAKSVITSPAGGRSLERKGFHMISGLAWSGAGAITRVDVSVDGGRNWTPTTLEAPVLPKCLTRFHCPWEWRGKTALLQSRAIDSTGYVQPTITQLRAVRGGNSRYHNNSIHTWLVSPGGEVTNVQLA